MSEPEDLGDPISFLVLKDGTPVYDRSGTSAGTVAHVLSDDREEIFHGLILKTGDGHRYVSGSDVDGLFQHGVIVAKPAAELPEPSEDPAAASADESVRTELKRAWDWLVKPH